MLCNKTNPGFLCVQLTIMFSNTHIILIFTFLLELSYADPKQRGKGRRQCRDQSGGEWQEGQSYTQDCVTYTCTKLGKKLMTMVPSVIGKSYESNISSLWCSLMTGKCCEIEGKGLYKVGDIIEISEPSSCSRKIVKCGMSAICKPGWSDEHVPRAHSSRQAPGDDHSGPGPVLCAPRDPAQPRGQDRQAWQVCLAGVQVRYTALHHQEECLFLGSQTQHKESLWPGLIWSLKWRAATAVWFPRISW